MNFRARLLFLSLLVLVALPAWVYAERDWQEVEWLELMPKEDLALLENMAEIQHEGAGPPAIPDEIMTGRVVPEFDGKPIRIPGFVVPLKTTGDQRIVEFFLVPYFGACIHVPPPPPNQLIHVTYKPGFELDVLYNAFWIKGVLKVERNENATGTSSYAMVAEDITAYEQ